jgi:3-oxoacyl-[acyl-carrier protein] reductase
LPSNKTYHTEANHEENIMRLKDKVTLVTGAGSGFGAGIARLFASEGAKVVVNDINDNAGQTIAQEIRQAGGSATYVHADVASREDTRLMIQAAIDFGGRLDVLVNNAGFTHRNKPFLDVTEDEFDRVYDVNVKAIFHALQEALPIFLEQGAGSVINTSSTAALRPRPGLGVYCSSKGAVNNLTKSLAIEFADKNIRINAVCPVIGETGLLETFMGAPDTPENRAKFQATIPMGRLSTPQDIARAALFLASDDAAFITGITMEVDGGRCI